MPVSLPLSLCASGSLYFDHHPREWEHRVSQQLLRVQNFNVASDGIGAGENQSFESPFGLDPGAMFAWGGATASWPTRTDPGGSRGLDDDFTRDFARHIGAEIMGRNKFGP